MNHRSRANMNSTLLWSVLALIACETDATPTTPTEPATEDAGAAGSEEEGTTRCARGHLEADFTAGPLMGPGVVDGALVAAEYMLSTTYLELRQEPDAQRRFGALMGPIMADLMKREGLVAVALGTSQECGTARTLSIWRDDVAMMSFVVGDAHRAAMGAVREVSRGGSLVTHWLGDQGDATWATAAQRAGDENGPFY
jgi:hypothetical protein